MVISFEHEEELDFEGNRIVERAAQRDGGDTHLDALLCNVL